MVVLEKVSYNKKFTYQVIKKKIIY